MWTTVRYNQCNPETDYFLHLKVPIATCNNIEKRIENHQNLCVTPGQSLQRRPWPDSPVCEDETPKLGRFCPNIEPHTCPLPRYLIRSRNTQICANLQKNFLQEVQTFKLWNLFDHLENSIMEPFHTGPLLMLVWVALTCSVPSGQHALQCRVLISGTHSVSNISIPFHFWWVGNVWRKVSVTQFTKSCGKSYETFWWHNFF